jgi:hypothetical protein
VTVSGRLVPAARSAGHGPNPDIQSSLGTLTSANGFNADTPLFDLLVAEYRRDFRTVPGDPWGEYPLPHITGGHGGGRFSLPPGGPSAAR